MIGSSARRVIHVLLATCLTVFDALPIPETGINTLIPVLDDKKVDAHTYTSRTSVSADSFPALPVKDLHKLGPVATIGHTLVIYYTTDFERPSKTIDEIKAVLHGPTPSLTDMWSFNSWGQSTPSEADFEIVEVKGTVAGDSFDGLQATYSYVLRQEPVKTLTANCGGASTTCPYDRVMIMLAGDSAIGEGSMIQLDGVLPHSRYFDKGACVARSSKPICTLLLRDITALPAMQQSPPAPLAMLSADSLSVLGCTQARMRKRSLTS